MALIAHISDLHVGALAFHEELLNKKGGLYKKLWDLQAGGFKNII